MLLSKQEHVDSPCDMHAIFSQLVFNPFKLDRNTTMIPLKKQKRLCSNFDNMLYVGLSDSFNLKKRFLNDLTPLSKKKRGTTNKCCINMRKIWLDSTEGLKEHDSYEKIRSLRMKLLQFYEDVRPAYYGTWTKTSNMIINGRDPFAKDTRVLNYEYDSEAEWDHDVEGDDVQTLNLEDEEDDDLLLQYSTDDDDNSMVNVINFDMVKAIAYTHSFFA